jgi:thiamine-phosphate pyrophosphorylase
MGRRSYLYYITDSSQLETPERVDALLERIGAAFRAGVDWVQVREKRMPARALCGLVERAARLPEKGAGKLLVNERLDVALACGADGVHLPADSLPAGAVRRATPRDFLVGVSCHTVEEVEAAAREGASFAVLGPIFATPGKGPPLGVDLLREACGRVAPLCFPVLALGGVTLENAVACLDAGAAGLAAIRLFQTADVATTVARLRSLS